MTSFEKFRRDLEDQGVHLRLQWEIKREQCTVQFYAVRNGAIPELIVRQWPDGFDTFYPAESNKIADDVDRIVGLKQGEGAA